MMLSAAADPVYTVSFVSIPGCVSMPFADQRTQAYLSCTGCFSKLVPFKNSYYGGEGKWL